MNQETATLQRPATELVQDAGSPRIAVNAPDGLAAAAGSLSATLPRYFAQAPMALDVLGGLADHAGGGVLTIPFENSVTVCVQPRRDGKVSILHAAANGSNGRLPSELDASLLGAAARAPRNCNGTAHRFEDLIADDVGQFALAVLVEMLSAELLVSLDDGLSLVIESSTEIADWAAVCAAIMNGAMASQDRALPLSLAATVFQRVERHWFARPGGRASISGALLGQPGSLTEVRTDSWTQGTAVRLPESWKLVGVDCGVIHSDAADKYTRAGAAAIMGRVLVNRILRHEGLDERRWNGHIAHLSVVDYVEKVRDRLPTRMKGSEFLARFGEFDDSLTRIEPDTWYKVRSRTEHHIYEQVRVREFMDAAARASRKPDDGILAEAAEPIHASHWSYGQRCGLGSVETDSLVSAMRHAASPSPFVAAKICGCGSGGMMAVLMRASDQAEHALHQVLQSYQRRTGMTPKVFKLAAAGAKLTGVQRL